MTDHALYRRKVCHLLSQQRGVGGSSSTSGESPSSIILQAMESNLGCRALEKDNDARTSNNIDLKNSFDFSIPVELLHCHGCGVWWKDDAVITRVNSIGRGKTRRRRHSRRVFTAKRQKKTRTRQEEQKDNDDQQWRNMFASVTNGACRSVVTQECRQCGSQRKMRGMPPKKSIKANCKDKNRQKDKNQESKARVANDKETVSHVVASQDFVPLTALGSDQHAAGKSGVKARQQTIKASGSVINPLTVPGGSRKKKKQKKSKSGGLMSFLSSLND